MQIKAGFFVRTIHFSCFFLTIKLLHKIKASNELKHLKHE